MKRVISFFVLCIFICSAFILPAQAAALHDLQNHWSAGDVNKLITRGSVGGYPDGTFKPDATITRAEFSKILRQSLGLTTVTGSPFADTANHWAVSDIQTLAENQIIVPAEYGDNYGPDYNITRREIAIMLVRAMGLNDSAAAYAGEATGFADDSIIKSYDKGYLYLAKELGLIGGYEDGTFRPANKATRAEACVMIVRLLTLMGIDVNTPAQPDAVPGKPAEPTKPTAPTEPNDSANNNQAGYQLTLTDTQRTNINSLGEQYLQAGLQLTIPNKTDKALTISENNLKTLVTYSSGAQVIARETPFLTTVAASKTGTINTDVMILLPNNQVANMVLGNAISNIKVQLTINGQVHTFDNVDAALLSAVQ